MHTFSSLPFLVIAQNLPTAASGPAAGADPVATGAQIESVWDFMLKGGPAMAAIALCSMIALTVFIERLIVLRRKAVMPPRFEQQLAAVADDRTRALDMCRANGSPLAGILAAAVRRRGDSPESVRTAMADAGGREMVRLRRRLRLLGALPQVSTMLGLLGTIFGMIKTFQAVAASGQALGKTETLAAGIFEAWTCTAAGLLVAIPVLVAYHVLMGKVDMLAADLDRMAVDWLDRERPQRAAPAVHAGDPRSDGAFAPRLAGSDDEVPVDGVMSST